MVLKVDEEVTSHDKPCKDHLDDKEVVEGLVEVSHWLVSPFDLVVVHDHDQAIQRVLFR